MGESMVPSALRAPRDERTRMKTIDEALDIVLDATR